MHQFNLGCLQGTGDAVALDHFRDLRSHHMGAEQCARLGVEHGLHEAFRLTHRNRLAISDEGEAPNLYLMPAGLGGSFREPNRGHLRPAIGTARNVQRIHGMRMQPGDGFDANDPLMRSLMRQPGRAGQITNGIDAGFPRAAKGIGQDMGAIYLDLGAFQAKVFDIADNANCADQPIRLDLGYLAAGFHNGRNGVAFLAHALQLGADQHFHALFFESLMHKGRNLSVFYRQNAIHRFNERHFGPHIAIEGRKFRPDGAGPDHNQPLRQGRRRHGFAIGPNQFAIRFNPRQHAGTRTSRQNDVLGDQLRHRLAILAHHKLASARKLGVPIKHRDLVLAQQMLHAARKLPRHAA